MTSEWLKVMLAEIARKREEAEQGRLEEQRRRAAAVVTPEVVAAAARARKPTAGRGRRA